MLVSNRQRRVTGLAVTSAGDVLVSTAAQVGVAGRYHAGAPGAVAGWQAHLSTRLRSGLPRTPQNALVRYLRKEPWSAERHRHWPAPFRAVVQALLLCAHRQPAAPGAPTGLWALPLPLLQHIAGMAAGQRTDWLPAAEEAAAAAAEEGQAAAGAAAAGAGDAAAPAAAAAPGAS